MHQFGKPKAKSTEAGIATWIETATAVGVRIEDNKLKVCAPHGLYDLMHMIIRPIKLEGRKGDFESNIKRKEWKKKWPKIKIKKRPRRIPLRLRGQLQQL